MVSFLSGHQQTFPEPGPARNVTVPSFGGDAAAPGSGEGAQDAPNAANRKTSPAGVAQRLCRWSTGPGCRLDPRVGYAGGS